jgi:maleylpyruvate isomerase
MVGERTMRELSDSMRWLEAGTALFAETLAAVGDERLATPSVLPGWTVGHIAAHVALNAEALGNLVTWARTGVETPMYASGKQRAAAIEAGATKSGAELRQWCAESAARLTESLAELTPEQWQVPVRTRAGREIPATEIPWMRDREVMVHAVDLGGHTGFADLPEDFLGALVDDVATYRSGLTDHPAVVLMSRNTGEAWAIAGTGTSVRVMARLADLAAWVTGRGGADLKVLGPGAVPELPRWL